MRQSRRKNRTTPTAKEYRQQAKEFFELAKEAKEQYAIQVMMELAEEFNKAAEELERKSSQGEERPTAPETTRLI